MQEFGSDEESYRQDALLPVGRPAVANLQFTVLSPEHIRKLAVVDIFEPMLYERRLRRNNSVLDLRMGTTDRRFRCSTCKNTVTTCNGHFGKN